MVSPTYSFRLSQHGLDLDPSGHHAQSWPSACRAATTANITIATALNNGDSLDGVTLATGDRVLVKDQSTGSQNGIYIVGASPARAEDYDTSGQIVGSVVVVSEGTANGDTAWQCTTNGPITVGTTALVYAAFGGGGTPDLASVLAVGNDVGGTPIISDDPAFASPAMLDFSGSGDASLIGADAGVGTDGNGGDVELAPGVKDGTGRDGLVVMATLPTSDPGVPGALWDNSGVIMRSP